jgi:hypothetical protein
MNICVAGDWIDFCNQNSNFSKLSYQGREEWQEVFASIFLKDLRKCHHLYADNAVLSVFF